MRIRFRFIRYITWIATGIILTLLGVLFFGRIDETIEAFGTVKPRNCVKVKSKVGGIIEKVCVREGDKVETGDTLIILDDRGIRLEFEKAKSDLEAAKAVLLQLETEYQTLTYSESFEAGISLASLFQAKRRMEVASRQYERVNKLYEQKFVGKQEWEEAKLNYDLRKSEYETLKQRLELLKSRYRERIENKKNEIGSLERSYKFMEDKLRNTVIVSPLSGTVLTPNIEELKGAKLSEGDVVLEIGDLTEMDFVTLVGERDIPRIKVGQNVKIFINAFPHRRYKVFEGEVTLVSQEPKITRQGIAFEVEGRIHEPWLWVDSEKVYLRPGLSGKIRIIVRPRVRLIQILVEEWIRR